MYKVFISDRPLIISEYPNEVLQSNPGFETGTGIREAVSKLENGSAEGIVLSGNEAGLWKEFINNYKIIEAAGGVVKNTKGDLLFIYRLDKWDLPKGKIEEGEDKREAAIREVEEECSIDGLSIIRELNPTYHTYELKGKRILKRTYWFMMQTTNQNKPSPQQEEGIEEVVWVNASDVSEQLENTYNSIRDVLKEALGL